MINRPPTLTPGALRIAAERWRQIAEEGYTADHDDGLGAYAGRELAQAGLAYVMAVVEHPREGAEWWPWDPRAFRPSGDTVRDLERAGALIAAALDRELRLRDQTTLGLDGARP